TEIAVSAGERLRIEISSSNFPKYDRNPNTGEDPFSADELHKADQTLFHGAEQASYIVLPLRRSPLLASVGNREPLVRPLEVGTPAPAEVVGTDALALLVRGRKELDDAQVDQAVASFERAAELRPDSTEAHYWLGRAYLAQPVEKDADGLSEVHRTGSEEHRRPFESGRLLFQRAGRGRRQHGKRDRAGRGDPQAGVSRRHQARPERSRSVLHGRITLSARKGMGRGIRDVRGGGQDHG
ncbi:MAG: hypothetical protein DRJ50_02015, partial [Actinobacteria bacterium]